MKAYTINYYLNSTADEEQSISFLAKNKSDAWYKAVFTEIPKKHDGEHPYCAWVSSVTYQNGNWRHFNTMAGKPY